MGLPTDRQLAERELIAEFGLSVGMDLGAAYRRILDVHRAVCDERDRYRDALQDTGILPLEEAVSAG